MKTSVRSFSVAFVLTSCAMGSVVRAELSPESYANFQASAPESITVEVTQVRVTKRKAGNDTVMDIVAVAKVKDVTRSATNLRPGQVVTVCYQRTERAVLMIGPGEIPLLRAGQVCPMYLRCDEQKQTYLPAARSHSFSSMIARATVEPKST